jgi:hypothetical protein
METTGKGRSYITARGWEDVSEIINLYEEEGIPFNENVAKQYLQNENVVKEFCAYYDLYQKYKNDYRVDDILDGDIPETAVSRAQKAQFDERLSLLGMLLDKVQNEMRDIVMTSDYLTELMAPLRSMKSAEAPADILSKLITGRENIIRNQEKANSLSREDKLKHKRILRFLNEAGKEINLLEDTSPAAVFDCVKSKFDGEVADMKENVTQTGRKLHNLFHFANSAFEDGNEMLILVTELTINKFSSRYIAMFGCEDYHRYTGLLMLTERRNDMKEKISEIGNL